MCESLGDVELLRIYQSEFVSKWFSPVMILKENVDIFYGVLKSCQ